MSQNRQIIQTTLNKFIQKTSKFLTKWWKRRESTSQEKKSQTQRFPSNNSIQFTPDNRQESKFIYIPINHPSNLNQIPQQQNQLIWQHNQTSQNQPQKYYNQPPRIINSQNNENDQCKINQKTVQKDQMVIYESINQDQNEEKQVIESANYDSKKVFDNEFLEKQLIATLINQLLITYQSIESNQQKFAKKISILKQILENIPDSNSSSPSDQNIEGHSQATKILVNQTTQLISFDTHFKDTQGHVLQRILEFQRLQCTISKRVQEILLLSNTKDIALLVDLQKDNNENLKYLLQLKSCLQELNQQIKSYNIIDSINKLKIYYQQLSYFSNNDQKQNQLDLEQNDLNYKNEFLLMNTLYQNYISSCKKFADQKNKIEKQKKNLQETQQSISALELKEKEMRQYQTKLEENLKSNGLMEIKKERTQKQIEQKKQIQECFDVYQQKLKSSDIKISQYYSNIVIRKRPFNYIFMIQKQVIQNNNLKNYIKAIVEVLKNIGNEDFISIILQSENSQYLIIAKNRKSISLENLINELLSSQEDDYEDYFLQFLLETLNQKQQKHCIPINILIAKTHIEIDQENNLQASLDNILNTIKGVALFFTLKLGHDKKDMQLKNITKTLNSISFTKRVINGKQFNFLVKYQGIEQFNTSLKKIIVDVVSLKSYDEATLAEVEEEIKRQISFYQDAKDKDQGSFKEQQELFDKNTRQQNDIYNNLISSLENQQRELKQKLKDIDLNLNQLKTDIIEANTNYKKLTANIHDDEKDLNKMEAKLSEEKSEFESKFSKSLDLEKDIIGTVTKQIQKIFEDKKKLLAPENDQLILLQKRQQILEYGFRNEYQFYQLLQALTESYDLTNIYSGSVMKQMQLIDLVHSIGKRVNEEIDMAQARIKSTHCEEIKIFEYFSKMYKINLEIKDKIKAKKGILMMFNSAIVEYCELNNRDLLSQVLFKIDLSQFYVHHNDKVEFYKYTKSIIQPLMQKPKAVFEIEKKIKDLQNTKTEIERLQDPDDSDNYKENNQVDTQLLSKQLKEITEQIKSLKSEIQQQEQDANQENLRIINTVFESMVQAIKEFEEVWKKECIKLHLQSLVKVLSQTSQQLSRLEFQKVIQI
ncbi:hypothetical protein ABPG72_012689 [Tetrahymena utriculariae]